MEALIALLVLFLFVVLVVLPIWTFIKIGSQRDDHQRLLRQFSYLEEEVKTLRTAFKNLSPTSPAKTETPVAVPTSTAPATPVVLAFAPAKREAILDALRRREGKGFEIRPITIHRSTSPKA